MSEMKHNPEKKGPDYRYALPFFICLAVLSVVSFLLPLRPTFSHSEKRDLTKFPEFSVEALVSGDYFSDITLWFSDTFPGRESWLEISQYTTLFHGHSEIAIDGEITASDAVPVTDIPKPTAPPATEAAPEASATQAATEPEETIPAEEKWGGVDLSNNEIALGAVIQIGDAAYNQLGFSQPHSDQYAAAVSRFADRMAAKGVRVISAPAPTAIGVMIEPEDLAQLNCARQDEMIQYLHGSMSDNVIKVDAYSNLVAHNDEYIYFRTDHHWTQLGAYYAYEAMCEAAGFEAAPLDSFELWNQGELTGSLYGKARWPRKLRIDSMDCYVPQGDITMYAHFGGSAEGTEWPLIADRTKEDRSSRYSAFLASDVPMAHVVNESIPDAPNCVVLKDSYGNCYVPFLTQNYHHVYALDYRKYWTHSLEQFAEIYDIDDVILAPYLIATQASDGTGMLTAHLG